MLELIDVHTYYGESHILQGVSFKVAERNTTALIGRNGVGKTTTVHSIMGFCRPRRGKILFRGEDLIKIPTHQIAQKGISLVPQGKRLFPSLTIREHLEIAVREMNRDPDWDLQRVFQLFPVLEQKMKKRGNMLSGGERQMVAIARALIANPRMLLMDEPSEGLAPVLAQEVFRVTEELKKKGLAILLVEQKIQASLQVADYAYVMNKGTIVYESTPQNLLNDRTILTKFLGVQASRGE